jgi:hypothetical protein
MISNLLSPKDLVATLGIFGGINVPRFKCLDQKGTASFSRIPVIFQTQLEQILIIGDDVSLDISTASPGFPLISRLLRLDSEKLCEDGMVLNVK